MKSGRFITETSVEAAIDWLRDSAAELGKARQRAVSAGHMLKHIEAIEFKLSEGSGEARRYNARTTERYQAACVEDAEAAGEYERLKALREAAAVTIETWRTQESNFRAMKL
jgi:hypothetical protein